VTIKSRLIPFHLRPTPPLLTNEAVQSAYHHASNPLDFDTQAVAREAHSAHLRSHPGVCSDGDREAFKKDKEDWNKVVNWVMGERRMEKLRALTEEREKRLRAVARVDESALCDSAGQKEMEMDDFLPKKRRMSSTIPLPIEGINTAGASSSSKSSAPTKGSEQPCSSIFGPNALTPCTAPRRTSSPLLASFIRPSLSSPRPASPRRFEKRSGKVVYSGVGELSPRARGRTYTPPRILPSGDETAPYAKSGSPAPSRHFDFVSPLGPVRLGRLSDPHLQSDGVEMPALTLSESMAANSNLRLRLGTVNEEPDEERWMTVRRKRGGSMPMNLFEGKGIPVAVGGDDRMDL
jgi:hypothetical protein